MQIQEFLDFDPEKLYKIETFNQYPLRIKSHDCNTGAKLEVGERQKILNNSVFTFQSAGFGYYKIKVFHSDLPLGVENKSVDKNVAIVQGLENQGTNQQFKFVKTRNNSVLIRARNSSLVWNVQDIKMETGSIIVQEIEHNGNNQIFKITEINDL